MILKKYLKIVVFLFGSLYFLSSFALELNDEKLKPYTYTIAQSSNNLEKYT